MIDRIAEMEQIDLREFANAVVLVVCMTLTLILVLFIYGRRHMENWYTDLATQGAIALSVLLAGETLIRGWGVVLLYQMSHGGDGWAVEQRIPLSIAGVTLVMLGGLCAIRVFTPERWLGSFRDWLWIVVGVLACAVGGFIVWL